MLPLAVAGARPPEADLQSLLRAWTSRAVQACTARSRASSTPEGIGQDGVDAVSELMVTVTSALKLAARHLNQNHPLCDLPSPVIQGICSYLDTLEILLLSHASRGVRAALLGVPEIWSRLPMRAMNAGFDLHLLDVPPEIMDIFAERSVPVQLDSSFVLTVAQVSKKASIISRHIHRMGKLRVLCVDDPLEPPGRAMWSSLIQQILFNPAPRLATLQISYFGALERNPPGLVPMTLWGLFSGVAPSLRTLRLVAVRLSPTLDESVFENLTVFIYDLWTSTSLDDLRILARMPRLQIFLWGGVADFSTGAVPATISLPGTLHTLYFSFENEPDVGDLRGVVPVHQLRELWITATGQDTCIGVERLYSESSVQGISLYYGDMGPVALIQVSGAHPGGKTNVLVNIRRLNALLTSFLTPFPSITWLTIHEHFWGNDVTGPPPVLPAVTVLSVCLASPGSVSEHGVDRIIFAPASTGLFASDPAYCWSLPALREIRLTAPPDSTVSENGRGGRALSISLQEVAQWIRHGIAVEPHGRLLDSVVLSGLRIIDPNFCAAWNAVMSLSHSLQLVEDPDTMYHSSSADMDFKARSASFTGGSDPF